MIKIPAKIRKIILLSTLYSLFSTLLIGCATTSTVSMPRVKETAIIDGTKYVSVESFAKIYNLDYLWDSIAKKAALKKDDIEVKILVDSSTALINNEVRTINKETKFYQGSVFITQTFAYKTLAPLFREEYIERKIIPAKISGVPIKGVIIDPGHGGKDPGAIGRNGLREKDIVLDIAKRLKRKLEARGINVILTRENDSFVSLSQRSRIANKNAKKADFFISIHVNASRSRWISGVEVFCLSDSIDDNLRSLNTSQNYDLNLEEDFSGKYTKAIIWDLLFTEYRRESKKLARLVCKALSKKLYQRDRGVKEARFYVLKANMPTVLMEVGFISNVKEEKKLRDASYRNKIAQGIAEGIMQYNQKFAKSHTVRD